MLGETDAVVRKVSGTGAMWADVAVEVKHPSKPPILYRNITESNLAALLAGELDDHAVGVRGDTAFNGIPPLSEHPFFKYQQRIVLDNTGIIDPDSIEEAIANGAYSALLKVLFDMSAEEVIAEMTAANLRGRGGAGFPAGIKWESGRKARVTPKFVVVNSHEGEPNVYKDRRIHECDPHKILEGMIISSVTNGAERAYNYIGGEYPLAIQRFRKAVADAKRLGLIGKNILGTGKSVEVTSSDRRRCLHLWRRFRAHVLGDGRPRSAAHEAAALSRRRSLEAPDDSQQHRDTFQRSRQSSITAARGSRQSAPKRAPAPSS